MAPLERDPSLVLAFSNFKVIDPEGNYMPDFTLDLLRGRSRENLPAGRLDQPFDFALKYGLMICHGCVFRRAAFDTHLLVPEVAEAVDYWMAVNLARTGGAFYFVPETLMSWRRHKKSETTRISPERHAPEAFVFESLSKLDLPKTTLKYIRRTQAGFLRSLGCNRLLHGGGPSAARHAIIKSLRIRFRGRALVALAISFLPERKRPMALQRWLGFPARRG